MYFCIFEKFAYGWFYVRTLKFLDIKELVDLYDIKKDITHIEEEFNNYCIEHSNKEYRLYVKSTDPADTNIVARKENK